MSISKIMFVGTATLATLNIGGVAEHMGLYAYAGGRYMLTRMTDNRGQANFEFAQALQKICGGLPGQNDQRDNPSPCHAAFANRPDKKYLLGDDEFDS